MKLETTDNLDLIRGILTDPENWDGCSEDGQSPESFDVLQSPAIDWVLAKTEDGNVAGCLKIERKTLSEVEAHICINRPFRGLLSASVVAGLFRMFVERMDERINKLSAQIPKANAACIRLAEGMGFQYEGINRESVMKNGKFIDQVRLGITREEAASCLQY